MAAGPAEVARAARPAGAHDQVRLAQVQAAAPATCCRCRACASAHWPARLKIVGPVTTRRHCRQAEVRELKVIRSGVGVAGARAPPARAGPAGELGGAGARQQLAARADARAPRSMSLTPESCGVAGGGPACRRPGPGDWPAPPAPDTPATEADDEFDEARARPRFKANSISSPCGRPGAPAALARACLACELRRQLAGEAAHQAPGATKTKSSPSAASSAASLAGGWPAAGQHQAPGGRPAPRCAHQQRHQQQTATSKQIDYLKPGDWPYQTAGAKPTRRHSWICR